MQRQFFLIYQLKPFEGGIYSHYTDKQQHNCNIWPKLNSHWKKLKKKRYNYNKSYFLNLLGTFPHLFYTSSYKTNRLSHKKTTACGFSITWLSRPSHFENIDKSFASIYISHSYPRACWSLMVEFTAVCLVFRQGRAYEVWLLPINRR